MLWCWWRPGKLESIQRQINYVQCTVLMKFSYISMLGLNSECLLSVWILQNIKCLIVAVYQVVLLLNQALCANIQYPLEQYCPQV